MDARFINQIGIRAYYRTYWGDGCSAGKGYHEAHLVAGDGKEEDRNFLCTMVYTSNRDHYPHRCDECDALAPKDARRHIVYHPRYDTPSGEPEPGDLWWDQRCQTFIDDGMVASEACLYGWSNCNGKHLSAILPTGESWCVDDRASNCSLPDDDIHRCWITHGELPMISVNKNGHTCSAGAGSIATPLYHGFLINGVFTS